MWRRFGILAFPVVVTAVVLLETLPLASLTWGLAMRMGGRLPAPRLQTTLLAAMIAAAFGVLLVSTFVFGYHYLSLRHEALRRTRVAGWNERWIDVLFEHGPLPQSPLPREGMEALIDLREILKGVEGERLLELSRRYRIADTLLRSMRSPYVVRRLDALEALAKGRLPETFGPLISHMEDPAPPVRLAAARAAARTLATMAPGNPRDREALALADAMVDAGLPAGAIGEVLMLSQEAGIPLIRLLLDQRDKPGPVLRAALDAVGRLKLTTLGEETVRWVGHPDPEVRAASLRALGRLEILPTHAESAVLAALVDDVEFVRIQAARTASLLPVELALPALWTRLGDDSWWVRRRAAESHLGSRTGEAQLRRAADQHDQPAREMATQVLQEAGVLDDRRHRNAGASA